MAKLTDSIFTEQDYLNAIKLIEQLKRENARLRQEMAFQDMVIAADTEILSGLSNSRDFARYGAQDFDYF